MRLPRLTFLSALLCAALLGGATGHAAFARQHRAASPDPRLPASFYHLDSLSSVHGLPQQVIKTIYQTADGYLWFGTQVGLARYNGRDFRLFDIANTVRTGDPQSGLKNNQIQVLLEDRAGTLWIGTDGGGLSYYRNGAFTTFSAEQMPSASIRSLMEDHEGNIWIGSADGVLYRYDRKSFTRYVHPRERLDGDILAIAETHEGAIWVGTADGLYMTRHRQIAPAPGAAAALKDAGVRALLQARNGDVWIGTLRGGVCRYARGAFECFTTDDGLASNYINALLEDDYGSIWIGTGNNGVSRYYDGAFTTFNRRSGGVTHDKIRSLFQDAEGSIWIGTDGAGLNRLHGARFATYSPREGLSGKDVLTVHETRDGALWVGTDGEGISRFKDGAFETFHLASGLPTEAAYSMHETAEGDFWIGFYDGGICRYTGPGFDCLSVADGLASNNVYSMHSAPGQPLWIGTDAGINRLRNGQIETLPIPAALRNAPVTSLQVQRDGTAWVGFYGHGLALLDRQGKILQHFKSDQGGLRSDYVLTLYEDPSETLWVGAQQGGLCKIAKGAAELRCFGTAEGLFDDDIVQVVEDGEGHLWLGGMRGIARLRKADLEAFEAGRIPRLTSNTYDHRHGLVVPEATGGVQPSAWRTADGRLWFATTGGLAVTHPNLTTYHPPVVIERLLIDNVEAPLTGESHFPHRGQVLQFTFAGLTFLDNAGVTYSYCLARGGAECTPAGADWRTLEKNTLSLTPGIGEYRLHVRACSSEEACSLTSAVYAFAISPLFYETIWFYLACAGGVMLLGFGLYRWRVRALVRRQKILQDQVNEQTQELLDKQNKLENLNKSLLSHAKELRARELDLKTLNDSLEKEVQRQITIILDEREKYEQELIEAKEKAEESARLKSTILTNMSHEIRTPITAILGFAQILEEEVSEDQREFLTYITQSGKRLMETLNSILDLSKLEVEGFAFEFEPLDLGPSVQEVVDLLMPVALKKNLQLTGCAEGAVVAHLDKTALDRILNNLVGNALKFTEEGGVRVSAVREGGAAVLRVEDTGVGITEEFLPHIFEEFKQESAGLARSYEGSGLGLAITKRLVEHMGGAIAVESEKGRGATFIITFPEKAAGPEPAERPRRLEPSAAN